jgi:hypothetical protein
MGDWQDNDIPTLGQTNKRQASALPGQGVSDTSLLFIDIPVRADHKRLAMAVRQIINPVPDSRAGDIIALKEQLAELSVTQQQLTTALQAISSRQQSMSEQLITLSHTASAVAAPGTI